MRLSIEKQMMYDEIIKLCALREYEEYKEKQKIPLDPKIIKATCIATSALGLIGCLLSATAFANTLHNPNNAFPLRTDISFGITSLEFLFGGMIAYKVNLPKTKNKDKKLVNISGCGALESVSIQVGAGGQPGERTPLI